MQTGIATVSISGDLPEKLAAIAAAGFDSIEIFENDFLASELTPRDVAQMVRDHGLRIALFQPFRDFEGMPANQRPATFDRAERKFDLMGELETGLVLVCSSVSPVALGGIQRAADDFAELGERAKARGLKIGYEALAWGRYVNDHRDAWEVVRRADHPNVGLILDSFHTLSRGIDVDSIRAIPGDRIFFVQLADAPKIDMDLLYWSRHFRNMPGQGDLDVTGFMRAVAATGYDGTVSLEIFNDQFRSGSPKMVSVDGYRSLYNLLDDVRRTEPETPKSYPTLPPRVDVKGVEFIEFAADESEAETLGALLSTLGFTACGHHVSKAVTLWRQGNINVLVNTEREGFAHSAYLVGGTSICDIGFKVSDAAAIAERARGLGSPLFDQPVGPGELQIPAIRGAGTSLLHFIDDKSGLSRLWEVDFTTAPATDAVPAGLIRIDHVAQTMDYEEMLSWVLFYTALTNTHKLSMVDVADPGGLVRSQAIETADGSLRITLNGADNHRTLAGQFVARSMGAAVQHVAFATEDLLNTMDNLLARGFAPLEISPNYYADLEARFHLDPAFVADLKARHILYDRDDHGEYLQAYSQNYGEGFFFEIVERRGPYAGYGAANAPFRIAAQKRHLPPKGMPRG